jgi:hypothetical protein
MYDRVDMSTSTENANGKTVEKRVQVSHLINMIRVRPFCEEKADQCNFIRKIVIGIPQGLTQPNSHY